MSGKKGNIENVVRRAGHEGELYTDEEGTSGNVTAANTPRGG